MSPVRWAGAAMVLAVSGLVAPGTALAQHDHHDHGAMAGLPADSAPAPTHKMWMRSLGRGWTVMSMAQVFPIVSAAGLEQGPTLAGRAVYLTQPALMSNVASPGGRFVLRTTLNFEAWTQRDGEVSFGGWGEGFIDRRHPHTVLHEAMLTVNGTVRTARWSLSAGKGFAPFGSDDPMGRPGVKFPTNHHLAQIVERWTLNAQLLTGAGLSLEAGLFGGSEPEDPYDLSNIESFGNSFAVRATQRFGAIVAGTAPWELSASFARLRHDDAEPPLAMLHAGLRHEAPRGQARLSGLLEAALMEPAGAARGYWSLLAEARAQTGARQAHEPYARIEYATRPEYHREGAPGTEGFWRYDHSHGDGDRASRWLIVTIGYGRTLDGDGVTVQPFVELQHHRVQAHRGAVNPVQLFGGSTFVSSSMGFRLYWGSRGPMRMGSYGALDPMAHDAPRPGARD